MASYNKIILLGNIGSAETKTFANGGKIVKASLATSKKFKDRNGELQEETQWHYILIAGPLADAAEKLITRGRLVMVEGEMTYRAYVDKDGKNRISPEVRASRFQMCDRPSGNSEGQEEAAADNFQDDLPF